jgi:hypothetical protein
MVEPVKGNMIPNPLHAVRNDLGQEVIILEENQGKGLCSNVAGCSKDVEQGEGGSADMRCEQEIVDDNPKDKEKDLEQKQNEIICFRCKEHGMLLMNVGLEWLTTGRT